MNFLKNLLSIDEMKASALILSLFIAMGMVLFSWCQTGDVPKALIDLTQSVAYAVSAVNVVGGVTKLASPTKQKSEDENLK